MSETLSSYTVLQIQKDRDAELLQYRQNSNVENNHTIRRYLPHIITIIIVIGLIIVLFLLIREAYK